MSAFWTPLKVGAVAVMAITAFSVALFLVGGAKLGKDDSYRLYAMFDDATGLGVRSRVQIAGIPIGQVQKIELDEATASARVWLRIRRDVKLYRSGTITKRAESILGDYMLDISPGNPASGQLQDGDELKNVVKQPSISDIFESMSKIADDVGDVTTNLRKVFGTSEGEENLKAIIGSLTRISRSLEATLTDSGRKLDDILGNFQKFSGDLSEISGDGREDVVAILRNTRDATAEAREILRTVGDIVGSSQRGEVKDAISGIKGNLAKLDRTLANVEQITGKINRGEGTIGHLVNDDKLAKNLDRASKDLSALVGGGSRLRIDVTARSEFLIGNLNPNSPSSIGATLGEVGYNPWTKNYFTIRIAPKPDKWYGLDVVDDPRGFTRRVQIKNVPPSGDFYPREVLQTITERQLKFSAYVAKRYGAFSGRFGVLENTGGFGLKTHLLNDDLTFALDAFEFANPDKSNPRLKFYADYRFLGHVLLTAGVDDFLSQPREDPNSPSRIISGRDWFIGAGFYFTDDDLKSLFGIAGAAGGLAQ